MKLSSETLRFSFLVEKVQLTDDPLNLTLAELFEKVNGTIGGIADDIDSKTQSLRDGVNPRLFAEDCAVAAKWLMGLIDNVNQLPVLRHGLIEAMNDHCT